ncbi:SGNH/GDSL hydrolase family protein [Proteobacteria bacterium 005FR1]|nr:SGNH/GDSL hydrolase family protein [Proteobacteria bacterium 005FR1]
MKNISRLNASARVLALIGAVILQAPTALAGPSENYVALGDSFAAGNGTSNPDLDYNCFRSSDAYAPIIAVERPDTKLTFVACSGATSEDVINSQVDALSSRTDYVTVSMGGNDVGFSELISNCVGHFDEAKCLETAEEVNRRIDEELPAKLDAAYAAIKNAAEKAVIMHVGYPRFFGDNVWCWQADGTTENEAFALNGVADNLDRVIANRAGAAGVTHISVIQQFTGHDVCAWEPYLHGKDGLYLRDFYHPKKAGYRDGFAPLIRAIMG